MTLIDLAERGLLPDALVRLGIRRRLAERARTLAGTEPAFLEELRRSPVALLPEKANAQHYELPAAFFERVLGPRMKYSACLFAPGVATLAEAEAQTLALTCERAGLEDGMRVLDLGCGWGSLSLWIAERYPRCRVLAVSNAKAQAEWIRRRCDALGTDRVEVVTADVNGFEPGARFDRVVSVEMFEHARNWGVLLERIASWLEPGGRLFVHHFCHRDTAYPYVAAGERDWMARHFFTGGMMPSEELLQAFPGPLGVEARWRVDGAHYARTCNAWLTNLDAAREELLRYVTPRELGRWRIFFMACAELFGYRGGRTWYVTHARLVPHGSQAGGPPGKRKADAQVP